MVGTRYNYWITADCLIAPEFITLHNIWLTLSATPKKWIAPFISNWMKPKPQIPDFTQTIVFIISHLVLLLFWKGWCADNYISQCITFLFRHLAPKTLSFNDQRWFITTPSPSSEKSSGTTFYQMTQYHVQHQIELALKHECARVRFISSLCLYLSWWSAQVVTDKDMEERWKYDAG